MHVDRIQTHVISIILHIDSSEDASPWPIYIEDFHGNTHEVILTPGDILFYERWSADTCVEILDFKVADFP